MMNLKRSKENGRSRRLLQLLPLAALLLATGNLEAGTRDTRHPATKPIVVYQDTLTETRPAKMERIYENVTTPPEFPGGMSGLMAYLAKKIKYPVEAQKKGIQGRVVVQIVIDEEGTPTQAQIVNSVDSLLDAEALRLCSSELMPKWTPGKLKDGRAVCTKFTLPVMFKLAK